MAMFTTRIELHKATYADYERLHGEMQKMGFTRVLISDDSREWTMPTAEYNAVGNFSLDDVLNAATKAASKVGKAFSVLANQVSARKWIGLTQIT